MKSYFRPFTLSTGYENFDGLKVILYFQTLQRLDY